MDAALIGAASALAGVALAQGTAMLQRQLDARRERQALLRAKLEELADQVQSSARWLDQAIQHWVDHAESAKSLAPPQVSSEARRAYVLALLYFPDLRDDTRTMLAALDAIHGLRVLGGNADTEIPRHVQAFDKARKRLDTRIALEAQRLL